MSYLGESYRRVSEISSYDSALGFVLEIYTSIAFGGEVPEASLDRAIRILNSGRYPVRARLSINREFGDFRKMSYSDKVILFDSLVHGLHSGEGDWGTPSKMSRYEPYAYKVTDYLDYLAEGYPF